MQDETKTKTALYLPEVTSPLQLIDLELELYKPGSLTNSGEISWLYALLQGWHLSKFKARGCVNVPNRVLCRKPCSDSTTIQYTIHTSL
jgi:hypothetical protein